MNWRSKQHLLYVSSVHKPQSDRKTYTPNLEGDIPSIVMEFLSATDGGEYSIRQIPSVGKWVFYEQVLSGADLRCV